MDKKIVIGIASLAERESCLRDTVNSLYRQCDKIIIGLNNYKEVPEFLKREKIECYLLDNSLGDAAKYYKVDEYQNCYYLTADDDIIYPKNYVEYMIAKTEQYGVPVSLHGAKFIKPIISMYTSRQVFHCMQEVLEDVEVDYVGTGVLCFDTSKLKVNLKDFKEKNMADIWFGDIMNNVGIKPIVVAHKKNFLMYNPKMENKYTIYNEFIQTKDDKIQTEIIKKWK